jgi:hypothetical protein
VVKQQGREVDQTEVKIDGAIPPFPIRLYGVVLYYQAQKLFYNYLTTSEVMCSADGESLRYFTPFPLFYGRC